MEFLIILFGLAAAGIFIAIFRSAGRGSMPQHGLPPVNDSDSTQQLHHAIHAHHLQIHQAAHEQHMQAHQQTHQAAVDAAMHTPSGCCDAGGHHHHH
jgi:hypothetical protein